MSEMRKALEERLESLGISKYEVAKRIADKRGAKLTNVSNKVLRAFETPEGRKYGNLLEVIEAMGGKIIIQWTNVEERVAS